MKEKSGEKQPNRVDPFAVSTLGNEVLRPWTINTEAEERLRLEMSALENTITLTSPQKYAGKRGISVLDVKFPELVNFQETVHQRARANGYRTRYDLPRGVFPPTPQTHSAQSKQSANSSTAPSSAAGTPKWSRSSQRSEDLLAPSSSSCPNLGSMAPIVEEVVDPDVQYVAKVQRKIFHDSRRRREAPNLVVEIPASIRYHPTPQPSLLSTKMSATYLKMRQSLQKSETSTSLVPASPTRASLRK